MNWSVLIVDDEEPAREELSYMLSACKEVGQILYASTGMEAIKKAKEHSPEVIFLDIELPDLSGIQVAQILLELDLQTRVVFVTAYDRYAIEAFKLRAFQYILKPYDEEDLKLVFIHLARDGKKMPSHSHHTSKLALEMEGGIKYLIPKDIVYISKNKEDKNIAIHTTDKVYEAQFTLQELEKKLALHSFFRVHKSYLVNLEFVNELQPYYHSTYNLHLNDQFHTVVPVSRNYVKELRAKLEI